MDLLFEVVNKDKNGNIIGFLEFWTKKTGILVAVRVFDGTVYPLINSCFYENPKSIIRDINYRNLNNHRINFTNGDLKLKETIFISEEKIHLCSKEYYELMQNIVKRLSLL